MYKAMDVANYIINKSIDLGKPIKNLKLQKVLYYVQIAKLVQDKKLDRMFEENIHAWKYGPVVEEVHDEFKFYANEPIEDKITRRRVDYLEDFFIESKYDPCNYISEEDQLLIDKVLLSYEDYNALEMVRKTCCEEPWISARENYREYIDLLTMYDYYSNNKGLIYG